MIKKLELIILNLFNKNYKRVISFFDTISEILIEKVFDDNQEYKSKNILEIASRNDILRKKYTTKSFNQIIFKPVYQKNFSKE